MTKEMSHVKPPGGAGVAGRHGMKHVNNNWILPLLVLGSCAGAADAATIALSGYLNESANPFLVGPGPGGSNALVRR